VKAKYLRNKSLATVQCRFNDSPGWKALLKVKDTYLVGRKIKLGNGNICRLWKDSINNERPLCETYPVLFDICQEQDITVKDALDKDLIIPFRRTLRGDSLNRWNDIKTFLTSLVLTDNPDSVFWSLNENKLFSKISL
jgi:hypothetical protein